MDRHLNLEGVVNFRDFGGYAARDGRRLKRGLLWRSGGHQGASDADLAAIGALDLALVVDLRTPTERAGAPSRRPEAFRGLVVAGEHDAADTWIAFLNRSDLSEASLRAYLVDYYRKAPYEPRHLDVFARYFRHLAETDGPSLVHCAAGKDRTGMIVALTHIVLGVSEDDVLADYLLTNDPGRIEPRMKAVAAFMEEATGRRPSDAAVRVAMGVEADYLASAFAAMSERHGSVEEYLERVLGVDAALREALEARLLD